MGRVWLVIVAFAAVGCSAAPQTAKPTTRPRLATQHPREPFSDPTRIKEPATVTAVQIDAYQLSVPFGVISRNEKFWKRIDEDCVDRITYDVLYKNGVRVGQAPIGEWEYFKKIIAQNPATSQLSTIIAPQAKAIELPMHRSE